MRRALGLAVIFAMVFSMGCASAGDNTKKGAGLGAFLGALAGAAVAVASGGDASDVLRNAAVGAAAGAAIGAAVGHAKDKRLAARNEAVDKYAYNASQGHLLKIEQLTLSNTSPAPGEEILVTVKYTAISPNQKDDLKVAGTPTLISGDERIDLKRFTSKVDNGGGTMEVEIPITLSTNMPKGSYTMETLLSTGGGAASDLAQTNFYIG